jgi:RecA/RadA recombinase
MNIDFFKTEVAPHLAGYELQYSSFSNGDFGDLERVEFERGDKLGTVDIWSKGWMSIDVYDSALDAQLINLLLSPDELEQQKKAIENLIRILEVNE